MQDHKALIERFGRACELKQLVDEEKITAALKRCAHEMAAYMRIVFVRSQADVSKAVSSVTGFVWNTSAAQLLSRYDCLVGSSLSKDLEEIRSNTKDVHACAAISMLTNSYHCAFALGSLIPRVAYCDSSPYVSPLVEAFEAGAFMLWIYYDTFYVAPYPLVRRDMNHRFHCEDGPAFSWLTDYRFFYWHGIGVPEKWILKRDRVSIADVFTHNVEVRRAGCEIIGWDRVLSGIDARLLDEDGDPQIGTLYEGQIPGADPCGFLKVTCGTGRTFVIPTPAGMTSAIQAQAWIQGISISDWTKPEVRG